MQAGIIIKTGVAGLFGFLLSSCDETTGFTKQSFQDRYMVARSALEAGKYERANRSYARLLPEAGPLVPRIKLEYAHSHLRKNDFVRAATLATQLEKQSDGDLRLAALAVKGAAAHELGQVAMQAGDKATARQHMQVAQKALNEVLKKKPDLDPLGGLAGRQATLKVQLKSLK